MKPDLFKNLPSEITTNILSRLSVRAVAISKCVCKSWLQLLSTDDFVDSHLSKSAPALAVLTPERGCTVFEIEDELGDLESQAPLIKSDLPRRAAIEGTANGLLLLTSQSVALGVCNPITREYVELSRPPPPQVKIMGSRATYGFGSGKVSNQYKAVRITPKSDCHVQTLGSGTWRCVEGDAAVEYEYGGCSFGAFMNGNLHWLVLSDSDGSPWISCFDVETERFSSFPAPASAPYGNLSVLKDCLCLCDNYTSDYEIVIWMMKESWTKEYVMRRNPDFDGYGYQLVYPIKVFKNGDILMLWDELFLFYYSMETRTTQKLGGFDARGRNDYINALLLTPSFVSLASLGMENVISF